MLAVSGCHAVDAAVDCNHICNRYHDCFSSGYDVSACESRCRDKAGKDSNYYRDVDTCEACIDDRACTSAVFNCGGSCGTVVP